MSTRRERLPSPRETIVPQRRLSDFVDGPVDLIKLDVEGAEGDVLDDLIETGAIAHVRTLVLEYHNYLAPGESAMGAFLERLATHGFEYRLSARERIAQRAEEGSQPQDILVYAHRNGRRR